MCITMKLRNVASWNKWLSLVYVSEVKQINSAQKFGSYLLLYTNSKIIFLGYC